MFYRFCFLRTLEGVTVTLNQRKGHFDISLDRMVGQVFSVM